MCAVDSGHCFAPYSGSSDNPSPTCPPDQLGIVALRSQDEQDVPKDARAKKAKEEKTAFNPFDDFKAGAGGVDDEDGVDVEDDYNPFADFMEGVRGRKNTPRNGTADETVKSDHPIRLAEGDMKTFDENHGQWHKAMPFHIIHRLTSFGLFVCSDGVTHEK